MKKQMIGLVVAMMVVACPALVSADDSMIRFRPATDTNGDLGLSSIPVGTGYQNRMGDAPSVIWARDGETGAWDNTMTVVDKNEFIEESKLEQITEDIASLRKVIDNCFSEDETVVIIYYPFVRGCVIMWESQRWSDYDFCRKHADAFNSYIETHKDLFKTLSTPVPEEPKKEPKMLEQPKNSKDRKGC